MLQLNIRVCGIVLLATLKLASIMPHNHCSVKLCMSESHCSSA